ncbi:hypothetical protein LPJ66_006379, partial [Kickxella alabastrina]
AAGARLLASAGEVAAKIEQETPMTNMHPSALTADPSFDNFQKAVKHPMELGSLKLPAAKKRAMGKFGSFDNAQAAAAAQVVLPQSASYMGGNIQQSAVPFVPAPMMLPPDMNRADFDRLPLETQTQILKEQQSAIIRQNSFGMGAPYTQQQQQQHQQTLLSSSGFTQGTNPLLVAAAQSAYTSEAILQTADEQRLLALEKDKWNQPLEYLMCVLDKVTQGAEKAGIEPSPMLQQAFWPLARKTVSGRFGVVASDAVL